MSLARRCDVCDTRYGEWLFRKRWKIFKLIHGLSHTWEEEMDFCDVCIKKFKEFIKKEKSL